MSGVVILGGGQGGFQVAASLRQQGFQGPVTVVSTEACYPYQRPPLSKAFLKDDASFEGLTLRPEAFYAKNDIRLLAGRTAVSIDREAGTVTLETGETLDFDHLVLATGARNRVPPIAGTELEGVHGLRTAEDAVALRAALAGARRLAVVGGGFIGLEVAATARLRGLEVVVLEATGRLMGRVVSPAVSEYFLAAHRAMGTRIVLDARVARIVGTTRVEAVELADGETIACDRVLIATGVVPNQELAVEAGLATANGVLVDRNLRTSDPRIFAIGDCAAFECRWAAGMTRLESVQNAVDQAKCVAGQIVACSEAQFEAVPWFWSDQGPHKLQMVGITAHADHVHVTGSPEAGKFAAYCFAGDELLGIETVNLPGEHMLGRKLMTRSGVLTRDDVERPDFDLRAHLSALGP